MGVSPESPQTPKLYFYFLLFYFSFYFGALKMPETTKPQDEILEMEENLLEDEEFDEDEDNSVETDDEVLDEESGTKKKKRTRKILASDNKYCFVVSNPSNKEELAQAKKDARKNLTSIRYTDNTYAGKLVKDEKTGKERLESDWRIWRIVEKARFNDDGEQISGDVVCFISAPTKQQAFQFYAENVLDLYVGLADAKRRRGRTATKIKADVLFVGQMLEKALQGVFGEEQKEMAQTKWAEMFAPGKPYAHYLKENGEWKAADD